jgi:hypothetical protein
VAEFVISPFSVKVSKTAYDVETVQDRRKMLPKQEYEAIAANSTGDVTSSLKRLLQRSKSTLRHNRQSKNACNFQMVPVRQV